MRSKLAIIVVILAGFAATGCATGGYLGPRPYGGPLGEVMAGNLALTCPGDVFVGPPMNKCLRHLTNIGPHFAGYPMYAGGSTGRQLSRAEKIAIVGGVGAAVGAVIGGTKGAIIGGVAGAVIGAVIPGRGGQQQTHGQQQGPVTVQQSQSGLWGPGAPFNNRPNCLQQGLVTLQNLTADPLRIFEEGQYNAPLAVLLPRQSACAVPELRYEAQVMQTAVSANGWVGSTQNVPRKPQAAPGLVLVWR